MLPRPTRRGAVVGAVSLAALLAADSGPLRAVGIAGACALAVSALAVAGRATPSVTRRAPPDGHAGESRTVTISVEAARAPLAVVRDALPDGVTGDGVVRTVADGRESTYEVTLAERGRHALGPVTVAVTDAFGLWRRATRVDERADVVVYPRVVPLREGARTLGARPGAGAGRTEFVGVREYHPGDPLRDVNWKGSAKRAREYLVTTYAADESDWRLTVGVDVRAGGDAAAAASAAASLLVAALDDGAAVGLRTADGTLAPGTGGAHRRRALTRLATMGGAALPAADARCADVLVRATEGSVILSDTTGEHRFEEVAAA